MTSQFEGLVNRTAKSSRKTKRPYVTLNVSPNVADMVAIYSRVKGEFMRDVADRWLVKGMAVERHLPIPGDPLSTVRALVANFKKSLRTG